MATEGISSGPMQTPVGTAGTKLETYTETRYNIDSNGNIDPKSVKTEILYNNSTIPGVKNWVPAAASTDGGKTWDTTSKRYQKLDGTPVFGPEAQKSLKEGALRTTTNQQIQIAATKAKLKPEQTKVLSDAAKSNASDTGTDEQALQKFRDSEGLKSTSGTRDNFKQNGVLIYPNDLASTKQDIIKFDMLKYVPRQFSKETFGLSSRARELDKKGELIDSIGTVVLPIPSGISDTNAVNWGGEGMNALEAAMADVALTGISEGLEAGGDRFKTQLEKLQQYAGAGGVAAKAAFAGAATGVQGLLTRTTGAIINPNFELLFQGPTLRPFSFTFKMSARNESEAKTIISILRFFKQGMAPQRSNSNLFLKSPHTFKIRYIHRPKGENAEHPYIGKIKECALQSFTVNYTPEGQYATFHDGVLVSYEMTMQFQELEPVFNDDYPDDNDASIGY